MTLGRAGEDITYPAGGETVPAYSVAPAEGRGRGLVLFHEAWGLVDHMRDVADRFARHGFVALVPDLFRGRVARNEGEAAELMADLEITRVGADIDGAVSALLGDHRVDGSRLGALGFCMGGSIALFSATRNPRVGAVVDFYGIFPEAPLDFAGVKASVLGVFGSRDEHVPSEDVERLEVALQTSGVRSRVETLPGVGHAFMNETRPDRYDPEAAARGFDMAIDFLRAELR